jgi:peptide/nickel transport system substrate-binding protein
MAVYRWIIALILIALAAGGCTQASDRQQAGELRVGIEDQPKTLDPRYATDAYGMRISNHLIFATLVEQDYELDIVPGLAERWENPDDRTFIFHIRPKAVFHDGEPVTAEDVKFTFEHLMDPEIRSPFAATLRGVIESIELIDSLTVRFKLIRPMASFLNSIALPILPEHVIRNKKDFAGSLIGSGPFKLVSQSSTEIVLAPHEHYYGGPPKVDRLAFKVVTDDNTRFLKMKKGELDLLINALPLDKLDEFKQSPLSDKYHMVEEPGLSYNYLAFNLEDPILRDLRVRQAIAHGINIEEIIGYRLGGHAVRATGLLSPVNPFHEAEVVTYPHDPNKAKALLDEAGFADHDEKGPKPRLSLELKTSNNAQVVGIARIIQAHLATIGIRVDTRSYEWGTFYGDVKSGNFRMTTMRWVGIVEPDFYYDIFHSGEVPPKGNNRGRYLNPGLDRLLEDGRITTDPAGRKAIYSRVQKRLAEDLPYVSLWHANNVSLVHHRVNGYRQHPTGGFSSFRDIWLQ